MADSREKLRIAVGLTRRATALLLELGLSQRAEELEKVIGTVLETHRWLRDAEMTPEQACLSAGIPLGDDPIGRLEEAPPPAELLPLQAAADGPRLVRRQKG